MYTSTKKSPPTTTSVMASTKISEVVESCEIVEVEPEPEITEVVGLYEIIEVPKEIEMMPWEWGKGEVVATWQFIRSRTFDIPDFTRVIIGCLLVRGVRIFVVGLGMAGDAVGPGVWGCTWMAFGGNTRDLGSFGEEMDKITDLHQIHEEVLFTERGDGVAGIKRRRRDLFSDGVRDLATTSGRGQLKEDLESST
ncbi:hypothetical protein Tco_0584346 [Tanacetum coccineum]